MTNEPATAGAATTGDAAALVVLVGHPRPESRTHTVAERSGDLLQKALAERQVWLAPPTTVDLAELAPHLLDRRGPSGVTAAAVRTVSQARVLVAASPTFRAAYSGLLKFFLDLLPREGLAATVVVPVMTAGLEAHRGAVEATLRPVLLELRARVPAPGIAVLEHELCQFDDLFGVWWGQHGQVLADAVRAHPDGT